MDTVQKKAGLEMRGKSFALVLVSSLVCGFLWREKLSTWVIVSQVAIGIPLWFIALNYMLRRADHENWWWFFLLIPLLRQMFFVMVPSVMMPFFGRYLLSGYLSNVDLGVGIMTLGNYTMFIALAVLMRSVRTKPAPVIATNRTLWVPGVLLIVIWFFSQINASYLLGVASPIGTALTRIWGHAGLALFFGVVLRNAGTAFERRRAWVAICMVLSLMLLPFLGLGARGVVMEPLVVFALCYLLFSGNHVRARTYGVFVVLAVVGSMTIFSGMQKVRSTFYFSGEKASLGDIVDSFMDSSVASNAAYMTFHRFGQSFKSTQFIASNPELFPRWTIDRLAGVITDNVISTRIFNLSEFFGFDHSMYGFPLGAYMNVALNDPYSKGWSAFPPEAEFYLFAGFPGVVMGMVFLAMLGRAWISVSQRVFTDQLIAKAMVAGVIFPAFLIMEETNKVLSMLMWNCFVLLILLAVSERMLSIGHKTDRSTSKTQPRITLA